VPVKLLIQRPIFIVGFQRGGSNILLNLLLSHPDVCIARGETQQVFKGIRWHREWPWTILGKRWRYRPIRRYERADIFDLEDWTLRRPLSMRSQRRIDRILYSEKLKARSRNQNRFKAEGVPYTREEVAASRLLSKNLNGLIFLTPEFARLYRDATFIALVRNGLAICEGHIRRGHEAESIARQYQAGCDQILRDAEEVSNYHLFRFEDLMAHPAASLEAIYRAADLDLDLVDKIRLEDKPTVTRSGERQLVRSESRLRLFATRFQPKKMLWYDRASFTGHFRPEVNQNQISRLDPKDREIIVRHCGDALERLGYPLS
jgi:hypothetical protein